MVLWMLVMAKDNTVRLPRVSRINNQPICVSTYANEKGLNSAMRLLARQRTKNISAILKRNDQHCKGTHASEMVETTKRGWYFVTESLTKGQQIRDQQVQCMSSEQLQQFQRHSRTRDGCEDIDGLEVGKVDAVK